MKMNQDATPLLDGIERLNQTNKAYFRIPGHRLSEGISRRWTDKVGTEIFAYDVTETPYTDDLHAPEGVLQEAQELLAHLYGADRSFFLINGTTCGNEAMIVTVAGAGEKIMIARNAHKSAMMGLIISGATPVYVQPDILEESGLQGGISPDSVEKCFKENPDCKALFLVSPSYYGLCSDLRKIANICHRYGALLLVDEAHGGHMYFHKDLPEGAIECGADMCVQSMHKVTGALGQSSVLHVKSDIMTREDIERLSKNLHLVQSTSPSYLLMSSLDVARYELALHGQDMMRKALELASYARDAINNIEGFTCMDKSVVGRYSVADLDQTRLVISAKELGITGFTLEEELFREHGINMELADYENVLAIVTYANTKEEMDRLIQACKMISKDRIDYIPPINMKFPDIPRQVMTPREAYFASATEVEFKEAKGQVSAEMIAPYPPGIPVVYPGEEVTCEIWEYLDRFMKDGRHIHGAQDCRVKVIK